MTHIIAIESIEGEDYGQGESPVAVLLEIDDEADVSDAYARHLVGLAKAEIVEA